MMVTLSQRQMLRVLAARARQCTCGAEARELPALAPGATRATGAARRSVEVDTYVRGILVAKARTIAQAGGPCLNQQQVPRVLLMRG
jgi:hypothetical protein